MNACDTYIALLKGYCALVVLVLPLSFAKGGYAFSALALLISGVIQCYTATLLVAAAKHFGIINFGKLAEKALGPIGKNVIELMILLTQFSFCISYHSFIT